MYFSYLSTSDLQYGFNPGVPTDACTGLLKITIALHLHRKTKVFDCFLDSSKAFDRVSPNTLFNILEKRGLTPLLLHFLWSWYMYKDQSSTLNGTHAKPIHLGFQIVLGKAMSCTWLS